MLIVNGGLPRSGTVLVGLIIQELLTYHKVNFTSLNLHGDQLKNFIDNFDTHPSNRYKNYLIHTHTWSDSFVKNHGIIFWNHRHPLDALASIMKLHDKNFQDSLKFIIASINDGKFMENKSRILIPYEFLARHNQVYISVIASTIGLPVGFETCEAIAKSCSSETVKTKMNLLGSEQYVDKRVLNNTNRTMVEDTKTFINDRHIQSGKYMRFKDELDELQITTATEALKPFIDKYGYN